MVTEDCNMRCKYCTFSGNYENMREHRQIYMDGKLAKEAIDKYFKNLEKMKRINPYLKPTIGFYGGEPLLNFNLIKEIIGYVNEKYGTCFYTLTTNGVLLKGKIVEFLKENEVAVSISLNGPKKEHDRLRVLPNQHGTFEIVLKNLMDLGEKYPNYYNKLCSIIVCYDYGSDLVEMVNFFNKHEELLKVIRVNMISSSFTTWYNQYSKEQKNKFLEMLETLKQEFFDCLKKKKENKFLSILFGTQYYLILNRSINVPLNIIRPKFLPFTGTCMPGMKIAVDPSGNLHCCEKMNYNFPIGNVEKWLQVEKIKYLMENYNKNVCTECGSCSITRLCSLCFALTAGIENFEKDPPNICEKIKKNIKRQFEEVWDLLEEGVDVFQILKHSEYRQRGVFI
ncbi:MAG: radical SAM protein [Defluviitoga tunisiensis]|nr:radical SAM protein [Defluviitoga tunisiensis]MDY0379944.1 radical SAM protein [Defluviitoga tunisiensis]